MRRKVKPFLRHEFTKVPLVDCAFHIFVTTHLERTLNSTDFKAIFPCNDYTVDYGYYGITMHDYRLGRIGIVLTPEGLNHNVIGHEIHHATMRVGQHIGCTNDKSAEEFFAQLAGWLNDYVYTQLRRWKLVVGSYPSPAIIKRLPAAPNR